MVFVPSATGCTRLSSSFAKLGVRLPSVMKAIASARVRLEVLRSPASLASQSLCSIGYTIGNSPFRLYLTQGRCAKARISYQKWTLLRLGCFGAEIGCGIPVICEHVRRFDSAAPVCCLELRQGSLATKGARKSRSTGDHLACSGPLAEWPRSLSSSK